MSEAAISPAEDPESSNIGRVSELLMKAHMLGVDKLKEGNTPEDLLIFDPSKSQLAHRLVETNQTRDFVARQSGDGTILAVRIIGPDGVERVQEVTVGDARPSTGVHKEVVNGKTMNEASLIPSMIDKLRTEVTADLEEQVRKREALSGA